jgi:hypothetical protein
MKTEKGKFIFEGEVYVPKEAHAQNSDFRSGIRPNALTLDGLIASELTLENESCKISSKPVNARLKFFYPGKIEQDLKEIDLYAGSKLLMRFNIFEYGK